MNWVAISTIAEVISAIAVVTSLIYVGIQIRQGNQLSRANAAHVVNTQYSHIMSLVASDSELAKIYRKATTGEELPPDEFVQYAAFLITYFAFLEDAHTQQSSGLYMIELGSESITEFMAIQFSKLLSSRQSQEWWKDEAPTFLSPDFVKIASQNIRKPDAT